jgi:hypothetical protein
VRLTLVNPLLEHRRGQVHSTRIVHGFNVMSEVVHFLNSYSPAGFEQAVGEASRETRDTTEPSSVTSSFTTLNGEFSFSARDLRFSFFLSL